MSAWTHRIKLATVDITARCAPGARVDLAESVSGLFDFQYHPASGPVAPESIILAAVTLEVDAPWCTTGWLVTFSGFVISADWDPKARAYQVRASTRLQEHFRALGTQAAVVAAITGSAPSVAVLGEAPDDLWAYAESCLETVPLDAHIDTSGSLELVDLRPAGVADVALTASDIDVAADLALRIANAEDLTNEVIVELGYSVNRRKIRSHSKSWDFRNVTGAPGAAGDFCAWFQGADHLYWIPPILDEIRPVFEGSSWNVPGGMAMTEPPFGVADLCFSGMPALDWYFQKDSHPLLSAAATGYQALACEVREIYTLTVSANASQTLYGATVSTRRTGSLSVPDPGGWPPPAPMPQGAWSLDTAGDRYQDQDDEVARAAMLQCAYQWASTAIIRGQRKHSLDATTRLRPDITLADTVSVTCWGVTMVGKVSRVVHTMSPPRTVVTLSFSRGGGGTTGTWAVPARPDTSDPVAYWETLESEAYPTVDAEQVLTTYVGGLFASADSSTIAALDGWTTNVGQMEVDPDLNPEKVYDPVFRATWPEIEVQASGGMEFAVNVALDVAIPNDALTLT